MAPVENLAGDESREGPSSEWRKRRLDELALSTLETAAFAGALLYLFFTAAHPFFFDGPRLYAMLLLGTSTVVAFTSLWLAARDGQIPAEWSQTWIGIGMGMVLVNTVAIAAIRQAPEMTFWFALVALACGLLFFSWALFSTMIALDLAIWAWIATNAPPSPAWLEWPPFVLVAGITLAALTLFSRRRIYENLLDREFRLIQINRELDQARKQAQAAERMQSEFIANVSHDVRTPVTAIIGETQMLRGADPEIEDSLETIETSARHLLRLIEDLLDISRAEAGELPIEQQPVELRRVVHDALEMVGSRADAKGLPLEARVDDDVPFGVRTDPHRLQQLLGNLLTNAVKFTAEGRVELRVGLEQRDPLVLSFEVEDTGPGIPADEQKELFQPFRRLGRSEAAGEEGTGLGLAICKHIVERFGGSIGVDSTPGEGSTFWFTLPTTQVDEAEIPDRDTRVELSGRTVWLVGTRGVIEHTARSWGCQVDLLPDLEAVDERLGDGEPPDAVVVDLDGLGGATDSVVGRVRGWRNGSIPVIVTGSDPSELSVLNDVEGPGTQLLRPVPSAALREALQDGLRAVATEPGAGDSAEAREAPPLEVLVVEDSEVLQGVLDRMLERLGYQPDIFSRGDEALEALLEGDYDLALVDLGLPGLDGEELARRFRDEHGPGGTRLVALSGQTGQAEIEAALDAGMDAYLTKPLELDALVEQLETTATGPEGKP